MRSRSKYKTRQRELLVQYFRSLPGVHITAGDLCEHFREQGDPIGQSTVYRQLEELVDEGVLTKYVIDGGSPACFEYAEPDSHSGAVCFHCKCEKCGRLIHLSCEEAESLQAHLFKSHGFQLDPKRTVFYGLCEQCR